MCHIVLLLIQRYILIMFQSRSAADNLNKNNLQLKQTIFLYRCMLKVMCEQLFLHPYTSILRVNAVAGAFSVFLCLITCFLLRFFWSWSSISLRCRQKEKNLWKMAEALLPMPPCWRVEPISAEVFLSNITLMALLWVMTISPTPSLTHRSLISARGAPVRLR